MTAKGVSALLENIAIFHVDHFLERNMNTSEAFMIYGMPAPLTLEL